MGSNNRNSIFLSFSWDNTLLNKNLLYYNDENKLITIIISKTELMK